MPSEGYAAFRADVAGGLPLEALAARNGQADLRRRFAQGPRIHPPDGAPPDPPLPRVALPARRGDAPLRGRGARAAGDHCRRPRGASGSRARSRRRPVAAGGAAALRALRSRRIAVLVPPALGAIRRRALDVLLDRAQRVALDRLGPRGPGADDLGLRPRGPPPDRAVAGSCSFVLQGVTLLLEPGSAAGL